MWAIPSECVIKDPPVDPVAEELRNVDERAKKEAMNEEEAFTGELPVGQSVDHGRVI